MEDENKVEIDLIKKNSSELEDLGRQWSEKIRLADENLQTIETAYLELKKQVIDMADSIKKARHIVKRLEREKQDIRTVMFRKLREGI